MLLKLFPKLLFFLMDRILLSSFPILVELSVCELIAFVMFISFFKLIFKAVSDFFRDAMAAINEITEVISEIMPIVNSI